jgi:transcriptional regulator with XRE-family HTH domain
MFKSSQDLTEERGVLTEDIRILFGQKVREARIALGISQKELAFRSGIHRTYISSVERGERNITIVNMKKIADALGVSLNNLFP